jgi:hypothetical protein
MVLPPITAAPICGSPCVLWSETGPEAQYRCVKPGTLGLGPCEDPGPGGSGALAAAGSEAEAACTAVTAPVLRAAGLLTVTVSDGFAGHDVAHVE